MSSTRPSALLPPPAQPSALPAQPLPRLRLNSGAPEAVELRVGGSIHDEWISAKVTRAVDKLASVFSLQGAVTDGASPFDRFPPYAPVEVRLGGELVMTGWIEVPIVQIGGDGEQVDISGRSKTCDLIDCASELRGTEFRSSKLDAICRAVAAPFGIDVVQAAPVGDALPIAAIDRSQSIFAFLAPLARMRGVLLTDDEQGRLVISRTGTGRQAGALELGQNLSQLEVEMDVSQRFSRYVVLTQHGVASSWSKGMDPGAIGAALPPGGGSVSTSAVAADGSVPRYRPMILQSDEAGDASDAGLRANWQMAHAVGRSLSVKAVVPGTWRDDAGELYRANNLVQVLAPRYRLNEEMLIVSVSYALDRAGRRTELTLGLPAGYTPEPVPRPAPRTSNSPLRYMDPRNLNVRRNEATGGV